MSHIINKILGKDDDSKIHSHVHKADVKCDSETCHPVPSFEKGTDRIINPTVEGRVVERDGVDIKSTVSSDVSSSISLANRQRMDELVSQLGMLFRFCFKIYDEFIDCL